METHPNFVVWFHVSDMILPANTNELYLTEPQARSLAAGYFFLGSIPLKCSRERPNGPGHVNFNILKCVTASAAEAETRGWFRIGRDVNIFTKHVRIIGFPHSPLHKYAQTIHQLPALAMSQSSNSAHVHWIRGIFVFMIKNAKHLHCMEKREENLANYFTKHHSANQHKHVCLIYLKTNKTTRSICSF